MVNVLPPVMTVGGRVTLHSPTVQGGQVQPADALPPPHHLLEVIAQIIVAGRRAGEWDKVPTTPPAVPLYYAHE